MSRYRVEFSTIKDLGHDLLAQIANLYLHHYEGSSYEIVVGDLSKKDEVLLLYFDRQLVGFTSVEYYTSLWNGGRIQIVYSGDTVVEKPHWGQQALAFNWIARMGRLKKTHPQWPLYWFVIVKGHRTYKYLPVFGKSFYPHWGENRRDLKCLLDALAEEKFNGDYNKESGLIEFPESRGHLKPEIAYPTAEEKQKAAVRFFLQKNPDYVKGSELACICELCEENMKPLTRRIFQKGGL